MPIILSYRSPEVVVLAIDLNGRHAGKDFIDVERVAVAATRSFQSVSISARAWKTCRKSRYGAAVRGCRQKSFSARILLLVIAVIKALGRRVQGNSQPKAHGFSGNKRRPVVGASQFVTAAQQQV